MEIKTSDLHNITTVIAAEMFENILLQIQNSNLNFKLELSPFAATISLKKSLARDKSGIPLSPRANAIHREIAALAERNRELENELLNVKKESTSTVNEFDNHQELEDSHAVINSLQEVNANLLKENVELKNKVNDQDLVIRDLELGNKISK